MITQYLSKEVNSIMRIETTKVGENINVVIEYGNQKDIKLVTNTLEEDYHIRLRKSILKNGGTLLEGSSMIIFNSNKYNINKLESIPRMKKEDNN